LTPDGPYGAQSRLQQSLQDPQTVPSTPPLQKLAPAGGAPQTPRVCPDAIVQTPPQQSAARAHESPCWMQNDEAAEHRPPSQSFEQQSPFCAHALPEVLHAVDKAAQTPPVHCPLQHAVPAPHDWPSETQAGVTTAAPARHVLVRGSHRPVQQSVSLVHLSPPTPAVHALPIDVPPSP
jgi:hypothetical protein